jgi:hypothetical protein
MMVSLVKVFDTANARSSMMRHWLQFEITPSAAEGLKCSSLAGLPTSGAAAQVEDCHNFNVPSIHNPVEDAIRESVETVLPYAALNFRPSIGRVKSARDADPDFDREFRTKSLTL